MNNDYDQLNDLEQIEESLLRQKRALASALDSEINKKGKAIAQKIIMGTFQSETGVKKLIPSYVTVQSLNFVAEKIKMGSEMPFMENKMDKKTGKLIIDKDNIQSIMQRAPDWSRQVALTAYLLSNKNHKFTTILAVIEPKWINDDKHNNWGDDKRAIKSSIEFEALDSAGSLGLLNLEDATIYALDGQHRIMGIKGIKLLQENRFAILNKRGMQKGEFIAREEFLSKMGGADASILTEILTETVSIEFVPAVVAGETREEARRRLRSYFVSINTYAKKVSKGEGSLLDEEDGYKIVAKDLALDHPIFKEPGSEKHRINMQDASLPKATNWITTLEAITNMSENFLSQSDESRQDTWQNFFKGSLKIRPSEEDLNKARSEFREFLDLMHNLSIFQKIDRGESVQSLREFPDKKNENNQGHLFLRPIGLQIVADAVGELVLSGGNLTDIFKKIELIDKNKQFSTHLSSSIFFGITVDLSGTRMITSTQKEAKKYLIYLIRGASSADMSKYISDIVSARRLPTDPDKWINFDGKEMSVNEKDYTQLPKPVGQ